MIDILCWIIIVSCSIYIVVTSFKLLRYEYRAWKFNRDKYAFLDDDEEITETLDIDLKAHMEG